MFKTLKEMGVVFRVEVPGISGQEKGHKIMHFVYHLNNIRDCFWTSNVSSPKCNLAKRGSYCTEQNVC